MVASTATSGNSQQRDKELKELLEVVQKGKAQALDTLAKQGGLKNLDINARVRTGPHAGLTPLHCAAARGDEDLVAALIALKAKPHIRATKSSETKSGETKSGEAGPTKPSAVKTGTTKTRAGETPVGAGWTPLHTAAARGHGAVVSLLLEHGAPPGAVSEAGDTALNLAAAGGHVDAVEALVKAGSPVVSKGASGDTPFHSACSHKPELAQRLVDALLSGTTSTGAAPTSTALLLDDDRPPASGPQAISVALAINNKKGATPLHLCAAKGSVDAATRLLQTGAEVNAKSPEDDEVPLHHAARGGHVDMVRLLVEQQRIDIGALNGRGDTALHLAMAVHARTHKAVCEVLLEHGAVATKNALSGESALHVAVREGNTTLVHKLLARPGGAAQLKHTAAHGRTALHTAVTHGRKATAKLLLSQPDCGRGTTDESGMTALHLAVAAGDVGMLRLFAVTLGAGDATRGRSPAGAIMQDGPRRDELCKRNQLGWCALHTAAFRGQEVAVRLLLDAGTPVNWPTADGRTAVHLAVGEGQQLTLQLLVDRDGDVNAQAHGGETPLGVAATRGNTRVAEKLLSKGAQPQHPDQSGWTPMHSSLWRGDRDLTRELLRHGGAVKMPQTNVGPPPLESEPDAPHFPAGDPIDHASADLKRMLIKQSAANVAADEAVVRFY